MKKIIYILIISIVGVLGFYVFQIGDLTSKSYELDNVRADIEEFSKQRVVFENEVINLDSLSRVEEKILAANFVKVNKIKYIPLTEEFLAKND